MIDLVFRFDPKAPGAAPPADAEAARRSLEDGNRTFALWMARCQNEHTAGELRHVLPCNSLEVGRVRQPDGSPRHAPFAIAVACSDARAPTEMLFGQGFNKLFVVRVAGNVLGDVCQGSVDYALTALADSVRVLVVLGHTGCGAVTAAADAYLGSTGQGARPVSFGLQAIVHKLFPAVHEAANALRDVWGAGSEQWPGYRDALIETAVCVNAAQTAAGLRQDVAQVGRPGMGVLFGIYDTASHRVRMPNNPLAPPEDETVHLADAPTGAAEVRALARKMAELLRPGAALPLAQARTSG